MAMTVHELIKELLKQNPNAEVFDTDANPVIGVSRDDFESRLAGAPRVYIEAEF